MALWHCAIAAKQQGKPCQEGKCAEYHSTCLSPTLGHNIPASAKPRPCSSHPALPSFCLLLIFIPPNEWRAPLFHCPKSGSKCAHNTCRTPLTAQSSCNPFPSSPLIFYPTPSLSPFSSLSPPPLLVPSLPLQLWCLS